MVQASSRHIHAIRPRLKFLGHVAADVPTEEAKPLSQAPYFALALDSCTDRSAKKEEMLYVRYPLPNHVVTHFFSLQA